MEFAYRATPTRKSESVLDAFRRLAAKYDIVAGDLLPQARSVGDLEPLREICTNASAFVLDVPLKIAPGRHWAALQKKVDARGTRGLELLFVGYGTVEKTVEPWKAPGLAISTPIERAVRTGFDFAAGRVGFEVSAHHEFPRPASRGPLPTAASGARSEQRARGSSMGHLESAGRSGIPHAMAE